MGALLAEQGRSLYGWAGSATRLHLDLHLLVAQHLHVSPPLRPTAPVAPEQGSRANHKRMQEQAHLARLRRGTAIPLALLAQGTGTTTTNARCIDDAPAPISLFAPLVRDQLLPSRTAQRAIRLAKKVPSREAPVFPGLA